MVRQVRLELTIPLLKRQVPSSDLATDAGHLRFPIADFQLVLLLAGLTRLELAISASTVQRFDPTKLQPRYRAILTAINRQLEIKNRKCFWVGRRELNPHGPQSRCGALPIELRPTQKGRQRIERDETFCRCSYVQHSPKSLAGMTRL